MSGFPVSPHSRRRLGFLGSIASIGFAVLALTTCSGGSSVQDKNAPISIQTSQLSVIIENKVGMPMTEVDVSIVPVGAATAFKKFVGRMENAEKRDLSLSDFYGDDGTPFSLRVVRPKLVRVSGKDMNNKAVTVELPWK